MNSAIQWAEEGQQLALAVVSKTWGSSPRQPGSMMLIRQDGHIVGSVSGGCVEGAVIFGSKKILQENNAEVMEFGVADEDAWSVGLSCGGNISVFVCPWRKIENGLFQEVLRTQEARQTLIIQCDLNKGSVTLVHDCPDIEGDYFHMKIVPKPRLFIVGAVHISQHLIPMAQIAGFETTILDPRSHFASPERFPNLRILSDWPDKTLEKENLGERDCLVTLTHDPKIDDSALLVALKKPLFCISCLGSKKTHMKRMARLLEADVTEGEFSRINGPAGIDINAKTPAEIAISILSELIKHRRLVP
jgi:xanthine dehydrogenase accessory factor